jgi:spermidine synthase
LPARIWRFKRIQWNDSLGSVTLASHAKKRQENGSGRPAAGLKSAANSRPSAQRLASTSLVAILAFASGCAALMLQTAWIRELRLVFGATTASVAAVLAIFMAGLGIGSAILGKRADRTANPLRMYGVLELAIALSAVVSPWLIDLSRGIYFSLGGQAALSMTGATVVRLALAAVVMAVPTFLMGGTLPAAVRSVTSTTDDHRRALGVLYGSNTLGAVVGSAVSTFFALEHLGTRATLWSGCLLGFCAGILAIYRARWLDPPPKSISTPAGARTPRESAAQQSADEEHNSLGVRPRLIYLIAAVLGFTFFALELVWYRMLSPILGGTTFTFGLILCVALFGIGVGGLAYNIIFRRLRPTWSALAIICGCEALLTIFPYVLGDRLALRAGWAAQSATGFSDLVVSWAYVTSIVVLPVALISGVQFPLLIALLGQGRTAISRQLGTTYAWNTVGAIAGSLVAGFGGLPLLSSPGMWLGIALLLAALSVGILFAVRHVDRRTVVVVSGLALLTTGSIFARGPSSAWRHSSIGAGRSNLPAQTQANDVEKWLNEMRHLIVWDADGIESSVAILSADGLGFIVNGKNDGNAFSDAGTQIGLSVLGAVLHENPKSALVIGLGTGESAGWLAQFRNIEHVDVVEIEPAIDEMASRCSEINGDVLHNPHVSRIYNDGREFVFTTSKKYDLIISEPSNPYRAGIASLYTTEFYAAVKKRLNPGGLFVQWLQAYEVSDSTVGTVLSTAGTEFGHVEVWQTLPLDLQLVCSESPPKYTTEQLRARISSPRVREALEKSWSVYDLEGFLSHFVAGPGWAKEVAQSRQFPLNTDDRAVVEYGFAKSLGTSRQFLIEATRKRLRESGYQRPSLGDDSINWNRIEVRRQMLNALYGGEMATELISEERDRQLIQAIFDCAAGNYSAAIERWPADNRQPTDKIERLILAKGYAGLGDPRFLELIAKVAENYPSEAAALKTVYYVKRSEWRDAAQSLNDLLARLANDPWVVPGIIDEAIMLSAVVAKSEPAAAAQIYDRLSRPFASLRSNYQRQVFRVFVADQFGPERVVEALTEMEPNVIWIPEALELRARSYLATRHPLAASAQRDWEWYQRHQTAAKSK